MARKFPLAAAALALATVLFASRPAHAAPTCFTAWSAATIYTGGGQASENNVNYTANYWTQNNNPATSNGIPTTGLPWTSDGACSGSATPPPPPPPPPNGPPPAPGSAMFAPYLDFGLNAGDGIPTIQSQSGVRIFTLAFIVDNGSCEASWGGLGITLPQDTLVNGSTVLSVIQQIRSNGGDVIISFGGQSGTDISAACSSANQVQTMYQSVIDRYSPTMIDFDVENTPEETPNAIAFRNAALAAIKKANPSLYISFTLPVLPTGLATGFPTQGIGILASIKSSGLEPDLINVMAMDYGTDVDNGGQMGTDAVDAATAAHQQVQAAGLTSAIGITPMIGVNDISKEIFQLADATTVLNFAKANTWVKRIAFWDLNRDFGSCSGAKATQETCSGLTQGDYAFSKIFEAFE